MKTSRRVAFPANESDKSAISPCAGFMRAGYTTAGIYPVVATITYNDVRNAVKVPTTL